MMINLETNEAAVVREILAVALKQLRIESARADSHDFRAQLHAREKIVEQVLAKTTGEVRETFPGD